MRTGRSNTITDGRVLPTGRALVAALLSAAVIALLVGFGVGTNRRAASQGGEFGLVSAAEGSPGVAPGASASHQSKTTLPGTVLSRAFVSSTSRASDRAAPRIWPILGALFIARSTVEDAPTAGVGLAGHGAVGGRMSPLGAAAAMASYNDRPVRLVATIRMKVTAYSPDERSCGASADGITASGYSVFANGGCMVAADPSVLPLGSLVSVPGYDGGSVVPVLDTGGAIKGHRLDVLYPTHELAVAWGVKEVEVCVWEYADGKPNDFRRVRRPVR